MEIWKDIKRYEGIYQVSNLGNVRSLDRVDYAGHRLKGGYRKLKADKDGYLEVTLFKNGRGKYYRVHRLVALAFIENPLNLPIVNHKDCNTSNNYYENLEWCTEQYNVTYGNAIEKRVKNTDFKARELKYDRKKIAMDQSKRVYQYDSELNLIQVWDSLREAARNGYSRACIVKCCNGISTRHKNYIWSFKEIISKEKRSA